ncbi:hypothetical protein GIB67_035452 [Kingdonia uniflora]|uniref:Uncharacterized protein n=1 Tax=Kingdonia uniflora TaxID=39325 RepID=A0A7J7P148_9MAGN|nr:hypothetical protein GIB67_035452 [Kingdonia uniflora]
MAYGTRSQTSSIFEIFTLNPLPYPVLFILAVIFVFLGSSWYLDYESILESTEEQIGWVIKATPIVLLILVRWLSTMENPGSFFSRPPNYYRRSTHQQQPEGASPLWVVAVIVLLLVMVSYQSTFQEGWFA